MLPEHSYDPVAFYGITFLGTWIPGFLAAFFSHEKNLQKYVAVGLVGLCMPPAAALFMIFGSNNQALAEDFLHRLFLFRLTPISIVIVALLAPAAVLAATAISLAFGKSKTQFLFASEFNVLEGKKLFSVLAPFVIAPLFEEIGWRGYGVDSIRADFNLFATSLIFGVLWGLWHLPLFFIKGYYQHGLWREGFAYVANFFVSLLPVAILTNWIYYINGRSILAIALFHSIINISSIVLRTQQFTKCIVTLLLIAASIVVVAANTNLFF